MKTASLCLLVASSLSFTPLSWGEGSIADGSVFDVKQADILSGDQENTLGSLKGKFERLKTKRLAEEKEKATNDRRKAVTVSPINNQYNAVVEALRSRVVDPTSAKFQVGKAQSFLIPPGPNFGTKYEWHAETKTQLCKVTLFLKLVTGDGREVFDSIVPVDCYWK